METNRANSFKNLKYKKLKQSECKTQSHFFNKGTSLTLHVSST